jgi:ketosteroid isomerase-like protein
MLFGRVKHDGGANMIRSRKLTFTLIFGVAAILMNGLAWAKGDDEDAVEAVVRTYEGAVEQFDFAKANSLLAPDARWIEDSYPAAAEFTGSGWSKRWKDYKVAGMKISQTLRDFNIRVRGDVAWATFSIDSTWIASTAEAKALNEHLTEWKGTFVESIVLVRIRGVWKIALGHTSSIPKSKDSFVKPDSIRFGATVKQMETALQSLCSKMVTRRIDPPFLDVVKDRQMQIDCEGFVFRDKPRHAEFVFGDDDLKMVWVMTDSQERVALEAAMRSAYGPPNHTNEKYVGFTSARVALRLDRPEILFYAQSAEQDVLPDITARPGSAH